jgi:hypothetical protein
MMAGGVEANNSLSSPSGGGIADPQERPELPEFPHHM